MAKRVIMRVELSPRAKEKLNAVSAARGMTQVAVQSRLIEWFAVMPEAVQAHMLGQFPAEHEPEIAAVILKKMKGAK
jgi:hypothetical protein